MKSKLQVSVFVVAAFALLGLTLFAPRATGQSTTPPPASPWTPASGPILFPPDFSPPATFVATMLDFDALTAALAGAPRERLGVVDPTVRIAVPLPDGSFAEVGVVLTQMMESLLAAKFPEIKTYAFETLGGSPHVSGHIAVGPSSARVAAQTMDGLMWLEPVMTTGGATLYLSYLDRDRTDGLNELQEPPDREDHGTPVPLALGAALLGPAPASVASGDHLRIYRLAATTTGEFYQARGGSDLAVVFSLIADLIGANAVFEPEVAVRLILANVTGDLLYDDATMDPFDNGAHCANSGDPCTANSDCDPDETCDANTAACDLRNENRDNMQAVVDPVDPDSYDLGFLFAARPGGGANGCAWFVVCLLVDDTLHKARGAGLMGGNGTNSASGLLSHEVGHMLGARHTFTGQAGKCTLAEFTGGDSESGYEPGSGTTRMSYRGLCADDPDEVMDPMDDNVDTSRVGAGSYYHSRSFDEIVGNVFSGDGSTCGTLEDTGNQAPSVDAGADYTIPRMTPFTLVGTASDDTDLTFNWEQFDRAETQRPIDTDDGEGPIIRSVPPTSDPSRTVPYLLDLLDGIQRKGEILPQVDRDLNFRLIARDNRMGGGGVAYDSMVVHVAGDPFFITSPNSGFLGAGCPLPVTWTVGGGDIAENVSVSFSTDGGLNFDTTLAASTPNDGDFETTVPCDTGSSARVKVQAVDNIFFDVSDNDIVVFNNPPEVTVDTAGGSVDDDCQFLVAFEGTASDSCGLSAADVEVEFLKAMENFSLGAPTINVLQVSATEVSVSGSILVSDVLSSPATLTVRVTATDGCGAQTSDDDEAVIVDDTPPTIEVSLDPSSLWPPNHKMRAIDAEVTAEDNCPGIGFVLTSLTSNEPDNGPGDGNTSGDIQDADVGTPDVAFSLRSERAGGGGGRIYTATYTATDGSGNEAEDSATVTVPLHP